MTNCDRRTELFGDTVMLRPYRVADAGQVWQAIEESRASLLHWVPDIGRRASVSEVREGLATLEPSCGRSRLICGVWDLSSGRFVGEVGLYDLNFGAGRAELGWWLRATARGPGYATEALQLLLAHAIDTLNVRSFEAFVGLDNTPSRRLTERLGMQIAGFAPAEPIRDGHVGKVLR